MKCISFHLLVFCFISDHYVQYRVTYGDGNNVGLSVNDMDGLSLGDTDGELCIICKMYFVSSSGILFNSDHYVQSRYRLTYGDGNNYGLSVDDDTDGLWLGDTDVEGELCIIRRIHFVSSIRYI